MKKILNIFILFVSVINLSAQTLTTEQIWDLAYPGGNSFTKDGFKIENQTRVLDESSEETRTKIEATFYYKVGSLQKSISFFYKFKYPMGEKETCHACSPQIFVAVFSFIDKHWVKEIFKDTENDFQGQWGEGLKLSNKVYNGVNCVLGKQTVFHNGDGEYDLSCYYNIETLALIKCDEVKTD